MTIRLLKENQELKGAAFREAAAGDFRDIINLVRKALAASHCANGECWVDLIFLNHAVAVLQEKGRYYQYSYTLNDDNQVMVSNKIEVTRTFEAVAAPTVAAPLVEAKGVAGNGTGGAARKAIRAKVAAGWTMAEIGKLANRSASTIEQILSGAIKNPPKELASMITSASTKKTKMKESVFLEALDESGTKWRIRVIDVGRSLNNVNYPPAVLREAVPLLEGCRVFVKGDVEHIKGEGKDFGNLLGRLSNPAFIEAKGDMKAGIDADFEVLQSAGDTPAKLKEAVERGMGDLFGFSIDAEGREKKGRGTLREATKITKINSVDLIIEPGAGGKIIKLIEAKASQTPMDDIDMTLKQKMVEAVKAANKGKLPDGLDIENADELETAYREALSGAASTDQTAVSREEVAEMMRMTEARADMRVAVMGSGLPAAGKDRVLADFAQRTSFVEADVSEAITAEAEYLAKFTESGKVAGNGNTGGANDGLTLKEDKSELTPAAQMLDAFFDVNDNSVRSFKECYQFATGDTKMSGHVQDANATKLREAVGDSHGDGFREAVDTGTWALVLGDSIARAMRREYNMQSQYDIYRELVDVVPLGDFRTQERTQFGGYGDLPTVLESGNYNALSTPTDEVAKYSLSKRGGTESVTMEAMRNDDVGAIRRIPLKLGTAAKRTLSKFVLDTIRNNEVIYDTKALCHVDHGNLGSAALDKASLRAGRLAMKHQTEPGSNARMGIPPMAIWTSDDLEDVAEDLFARKTENDKDFIAKLDLKVMPVWYWDDANDWALTASTRDIPLIELGFLDGEEEPSIFVQDSPTTGSMWNNDTLKYKIRHIYGKAVLDYRGFYKSVVL